MAEQGLIEAARDGDLQAVETLLRAGANVNQQDEQGWTPLNWAAGKGDAKTVALLLEHGADVTLTGRDNRTPLMIARAAKRQDVAAVLAEAEKARGTWQDPRETVAYCKAYPLRELRSFDAWREKPAPVGEPPAGGVQDRPASAALSDEDIVYLHQDFTVTRSMWHGEDVVFDEITPAWKTFCETTLRFEIPEDVL